MGGNPREDAIRKQIFDRQRARWEKMTRQPGFFGRILQALFGKNPAEALLIVECEAADPETFQCAGEILGAWRLDHQGLREVQPQDVDPGRTIRRMWQRQMVHFFISDDSQHVFLNEMDGPKQGMHIYLTPEPSKGGVQLKVKQTLLILGGHAVG